MMPCSQAETHRSCNESAETEGIRNLSAKLASNRLLVQASTGNTSVKAGDTLWIKASGKWLADAESPDFLIPVAWRRARACLANGDAIPETESAGGLCASIETAMHAVLPHRVVLHVHSVNAIAWAVRSDGPSRLSERLHGFSWQWIPYSLSGAPLAQHVLEASRSNPAANVFVLGNHGLVVCGETCERAERLLEEVEKRLHLEPRPVPDLDWTATGKEHVQGFKLPECPSIHGLASDALSRAILRGGILYPCQALFLPSTAFAGERALLTQMPSLREHARERPNSVVLDKDRVLCSVTMTPLQRELLSGLSQVVRRIQQPAAVRYLSSGEVSELIQGGGQYLTRAG